MTDLEFIGVDDRRWPDPVRGPWALRLVFGSLGDRPGVVAVELYAVDPDEIKRAARRSGGAGALSSNPWDTGWAGLPEMPAPEQITTSGVRLPLAKMTAEYLASIGDVYREQATRGSASWRDVASRNLALLERAERAQPKRRGPGRPPSYGVEFYKDVAAAYTKALREGRAPTLAVADELAGGSKSAASKWIAKARELRLLPPTVKGKAAAWPAAPTKKGTRARRRAK